MATQADVGFKKRHGFWQRPNSFEEKRSCSICCSRFTFLKRRHHCRNCMRSVCGSCSPHLTEIPDHYIPEEKRKPVRVCLSCRDVIKGTRLALHPDVVASTAHFDFDLLVIGGGSGGLACAKEAAKIGACTAVCDFVKPSEAGTTWGLGGTCVNVGCIPKKLMHNAALVGKAIHHDAAANGWAQKGGKQGKPVDGHHDWSLLVKNVQGHIQSLNDGYQTQMKEKDNISYFNEYASFVENSHTVKLTNAAGESRTVTARRVVVAVGGRPVYPSIPGGELCITSDDIFALKENPGQNVLVLGASYVALECAGFLTALGFNVTVMVRSILLRGFDQECAEKIRERMEQEGTKFINGFVPSAISKQKNGKLKVKYISAKKRSEEDSKEDEDAEHEGVFDTVLAAIGRKPVTQKLGLCCAGVMRRIDGKIPVFQEQSNVPHVYAIGDVAAIHGVPTGTELTPVAIQAGRLLAQRLFDGGTKQMDYANVATTIFTPLEYGCIGLTEDDAREQLGDDKVEVYHQVFTPLEASLPNLNRAKHGHVHGHLQLDHKPGDKHTSSSVEDCFAKVVLDITKPGGKVIGFHYCGPHAGEVTQGFSVAMRLGMTKQDLDETVGIHPTSAETLTTLDISKGSGLSAVKEDC